MEHEFKPWQPVIVRDSDNEQWRADFFSQRLGNYHSATFACVGSLWKQCLPAEGNEHLIGTTDKPEPPEPEFKFGDKVEVRNEETGEWEKVFFIRPDYDSNAKYVITVKKQRLDGDKGAFASGYTDALENMAIAEVPYIIEIYLDEVKRNPGGEEVFGQRLAIFTTPLVRDEEDIANDIANLIMDAIR